MKFLTDFEIQLPEAGHRRQHKFVAALLWILSLGMAVGVVYMGLILGDWVTGWVMAGADLISWFSLLLNRTRFFKWAPVLALANLSVIPILNVSLGSDHSAANLTLLLIWNCLTILLASVLVPVEFTFLVALVNLATLVGFAVFIPTVSLANLAIPLIFNGVISALILVFSRHRDLLEKDRLQEISLINQQLQIELNERMRAEAQLAYTARHDHLTGLPNRAVFMERLDLALRRAKDNITHTYAVMFIDLDRFKVVNDSLGHSVGDKLLIECARRLVAAVRSGDTVARLGGDEFVILLEGMPSHSDYTVVAGRILGNLAQPADLDNYAVFISASLGIVFSEARYTRVEDVLRDADITMYQAKKQGRGRFEIFDPALRDQVMTRLELETDLRKALENRELTVYYQPIMDMQSRCIVGFEALVRWQHPSRGLFAPGDFIPIAEEIGLIVPIGYWVLDEACRQLSAWRREDPAGPHLTINVNLSPRQCGEPDLVERIREVLRKNQLDAGSLRLEITEGLIIENTAAISELLSKLRALGVQVQIDDFGTGYSSLGYLHRLPIDTLKIDRTFIGRLNANGNGAEIVRTILELAHTLGMKVVAEGVETGDQMEKLRDMHCEFMQGFLFSKPLSGAEAGSLIGKAAR